MKKRKQLTLRKQKMHEAINQLDRDRIYLVYFSYDLSIKNLYHSPLIIFTKLISKLNGHKTIDHIAHISRFVYDRRIKLYRAKIFEGKVEHGMEENDLYTVLKNFDGECIVEELKKVNKQKAKKFELAYRNIPYGKLEAVIAGIDIKLLNKILNKFKSKKGVLRGFCSWLVAKFLQSQSICIKHIENGNPLEILPSDIYEANLGRKIILPRS